MIIFLFKRMTLVLSVLMLIVVLSSCSSTSEKVIVKEIEKPVLILVPDEALRPVLEVYKTKFIKEEASLICFDKPNLDVFNSNYYKLLNYIKALEEQNRYFRQEIEKNK